MSYNLRMGPFIQLNPFTINTHVTVAHGLANVPNFPGLMAQCLSADHGYAVNDIIYAVDPVSALVSADPVNLTISTSAVGLRIIPKAGGASVIATASKWYLFTYPFMMV
jgi:hypothetical protein